MRWAELVSHASVSRGMIVAYLLCLECISFHVYRTPMYTPDALQYMGNATLMEETDPIKLHQ